MVKVKPEINPKPGDVTAFVEKAVRILDDTLLEKHEIAVIWVSVVIQRKYPMIPIEKRRQLAARCLEAERKRRKEIHDG